MSERRAEYHIEGEDQPQEMSAIQEQLIRDTVKALAKNTVWVHLLDEDQARNIIEAILAKYPELKSVN